ncbi:MAG: Tautomerase enzyme [Fibrobacteres bacterium]|nr:Tautomerase enzyme [Fibrobacterota bacterium]
MAQIKIYGIASRLNPIKERLSDAIHSCIVEALKFPPDKRAHRFFPLDPSDYFYPAGRTDRYTIIEISMFEGRSIETKKRLIKLLFNRLKDQLDIPFSDVEITITETPKHNWGFRGLPGDEVGLDYKVEI